MEVNSPALYTSQLPLTYKTLKKHVPSIFNSECFNSQNQPFKKEVKDTEVGHLFEHILLEFLCIAKMKNGARSSTFSGVTKWNWKKEKKGMFHITIKIKPKDFDLLKGALEKAIDVMENIFGSRDPVYTPASKSVFAKFGTSKKAVRPLADRPRSNR